MKRQVLAATLSGLLLFAACGDDDGANVNQIGDEGGSGSGSGSGSSSGSSSGAPSGSASEAP